MPSTTIVTTRTLLVAAIALCALPGAPRTAQAQAMSGSMAIRVSVVESISPIAIIRPAEALRVVTDAYGSRGQVRFGIESDMPVEVSIRAADGSPIAGGVALASRVRLVGAARAPGGSGRAPAGRAFAAGVNEIGLDFNWTDFGDATRGTLDLPATEVRATARKGDAEVTVIAFLPAVSLDVPRQPIAATLVAQTRRP